MNKQELIEKYEYELKLLRLQFGETLRTKVYEELLDYLKQLDEPQKPTVPQFVAEFITEQKKLGHTLSYSIDACMSDRVAEWYWDNSELFALAWIFGCEVEQEKRYYIRLKNVDENYNYLTCIKHLNAWALTEIKRDKKFRTEHTKKQLEEAGFGWVFDCPGIEIEEVE